MNRLNQGTDSSTPLCNNFKHRICGVAHFQFSIEMDYSSFPITLKSNIYIFITTLRFMFPHASFLSLFFGKRKNVFSFGPNNKIYRRIVSIINNIRKKTERRRIMTQSKSFFTPNLCLGWQNLSSMASKFNTTRHNTKLISYILRLNEFMLYSDCHNYPI